MESSGPEIALRLARDDDAEDLARLSAQLEFPITRERAAARLREASGAPDHALIVAESGGRVAGLIELRRLRLVMAWRQIEVIALVVDEEFRGRGIGGRLLDEAERWARDLRCGKIRVRSNAARERAHSLYRRWGYEPTRTETLFEKQLGPPGPRQAEFGPASIVSREAARHGWPPSARAIGPLATVRVAVAMLLVVNGGLRLASGGISGLGAHFSASQPNLGLGLAWTLTAVEILGGVALAVNRFARPLCLWFAVELLAGALLVEEAGAWSVAGSGRNGPEYSVLLAACLLAVAFAPSASGRTTEAAPGRRAVSALTAKRRRFS